MNIYFLKIKFHKEKKEFSYFVDELPIGFDAYMRFVKNKITKEKVKRRENKTYIIRTLKLEV